ncbi:MAG TPA: carbohydrate porin [Candidatus Binatia bacterium]|jgi:porin|nr:carbohydrate porin [Candidatus Binatia bacterium]
MKTKQRYATVLCLGLVLVLGASGLSTSSAQDDSAPAKSSFRKFLERDYLFGDWGGLRTDLSQHGVDFEFFYGGSFPDNLSGGARRGGVYEGALMATLDLDSQKLVGYEGGSFHASSVWLNGEKPFSTFNNGTPAYVGDLNKVNLLDFPNALRLWELWYQQKFLDGKFAFKFGELSIDRDFIVPEMYTSIGSVSLINQTFFYPTLAFDVFDIPGLPPRFHGLASTPNAAPGAVLRWGPIPQFYAQAGVYGGAPDTTYHGTRFNLSEAEGALAYFEVGYHFNQGTNDDGLEGSYKACAFYHTGDFVDVYDGVTSAFLAAVGFPGSPVSNHDGDYGAYFLAEQQLFRENDKSDPAKQGLVGFFRVGAAPGDRNLAQLGIDGGLVYKGLIPSRDWDTLAFGASYLEMSDYIRRAERDANATALGFGAPAPFPQLADYETVLEVSYKAQLTAWWTLQPSLQRVFHPGGSGAIPNATVFILQTTLRF